MRTVWLATVSRMNKYKNASNSVCRRKDGVEVKRDYAEMRGYLDAKTRYSTNLLNIATEIKGFRLMVSRPFV